MSERTIVITVSEGKYEVQNNGLSEFELIGVLECLVFEMKAARRQESSDKTTESPDVIRETRKRSEETVPEPKIPEQPKIIPPAADRETVQSSGSPELRTRINNAVEAIKNLGGEVSDINRGGATDEELRTELEELTNQYKRLKNSKAK